MTGESFCRPVIDSTKKTFFAIGLVVGGLLLFLVSWFMGWLRF